MSDQQIEAEYERLKADKSVYFSRPRKSLETIEFKRFIVLSYMAVSARHQKPEADK